MPLLLANSELFARVNSELFLCNDSAMKYLAYSSRFKALWKTMPDAPKNQKELARRLDCSQATVSDWVNGEKLPSMDTAIALSNTFNCCVEYLITGKGPKTPSKLLQHNKYMIDVSKLTDEQKKVVELMVETMIKVNQPTSTHPCNRAQHESLSPVFHEIMAETKKQPGERDE
jgi:DNA-binding XRE family transcriptional regulator